MQGRTTAAARFIREFRISGIPAGLIFRPMVDNLANLGWQINRVNFGAKAYDPINENRRAGG